MERPHACTCYANLGNMGEILCLVCAAEKVNGGEISDPGNLQGYCNESPFSECCWYDQDEDGPAWIGERIACEACGVVVWDDQEPMYPLIETLDTMAREMIAHRKTRWE